MTDYTFGFMVGHKSYLPHGQLLVKSLRQNAGIHKKANIILMVPQDLLDQIQIMGTETVGFVTPDSLKKLPFADKMYAASSFEAIAGDNYVWMDVDSIVLDAPSSIDQVQSGYIGLRTVDHKNIGMPSGEGVSPLWQEIYRIAKQPFSKRVVTTAMSHEAIYPYYNVGMVVVRDNEKKLFLDVIRTLYRFRQDPCFEEIISMSPANAIFAHQVAFTAAVEKTYEDKIDILPETVNWPLHFSDTYPRPLEFIETLRYDTYFHEHPLPDALSDLISDASLLKMLWYY